ncbi:hypothetical protein AB0I53_28280 [Saccharopolyspora sp. NPDC050389]|uniref:hypothetical protein n=1 Tax=Saccharopolyspora sp. NPDC050389 TaxID=3155516 RepID=UPI0033C42778
MSTYRGPTKRFDELLHGLHRIAAEVQQLKGFQGAYVLVGRSSGNLVTLTFWDTSENAQASGEEGDKIRTQIAMESGQNIEDVEIFEVWLRLGTVF